MTTKPKTRKRAPQSKGGRPPSPFPERYQIRHTAAQGAAWMKAAGTTTPGPILQHWIRTTLDKGARS